MKDKQIIIAIDLIKVKAFDNIARMTSMMLKNKIGNKDWIIDEIINQQLKIEKFIDDNIEDE